VRMVPLLRALLLLLRLRLRPTVAVDLVRVADSVVAPIEGRRGVMVSSRQSVRVAESGVGKWPP
jgi:hypothetical protein